MKKNGWVVAVATVVLLGGLALFLFQGGEDQAPRATDASAPGSDAIETPHRLQARGPAQEIAADRIDGRLDKPLLAGREASPIPPPEAPPLVPSEKQAQAPASPASTGAPNAVEEKPADAESHASLSKDDVRAAIRAVLPRVKECYQGALGHDSSLAGKVVVRFVIEARDGKGKVVSGEVPDSETHSPFFDACVLEKVAGAEFPAPEGEGKVTVNYPFTFDPGGGFGGGARD